MVEIHQGRKVLQECISQECEGRAKGVLAKCPSCKTGDLLERRSPRGKRFVSCTSYPDCKNSYPLPQFGKIISKGVCEHCTAPQVLTYTHRGPWTFCVNLQCPERLARQARRVERAKLKEEKVKLKARKARAREKKRLRKAQAKEEKERLKREKEAGAAPVQVSVEAPKDTVPMKRPERKATKQPKVTRRPKKPASRTHEGLIAGADASSSDHVDDSRSPDG